MPQRLTQVFEPLVRHMVFMTEEAIRERFREAMDAFVNQDLYIETSNRRGGVRRRPRWSAETLITWSERVLGAHNKTMLMIAITDFVLYLDGRTIRGEVLTHITKPPAKRPADIVEALTVHGQNVGTQISADTLRIFIGDDPPGSPVPAEQVVETIKRFQESGLIVKVFFLDDQRRPGQVSWVSNDEVALFYPEAGGYRVVPRSTLRRALCAEAK